MKQYKYFHFLTRDGVEVVLLSNDYKDAEIRANNDYHIIKYLGWTEGFYDEIKV